MSPASTRTVFVDTNVLAYAYDVSETTKQPLAQSALAELWRTRSGALSTQVLQEFYAVTTRKFNPPMSRREARELVDLYSQWLLINVDVPLILAASQLEERHSLSFWDALIIEAARRVGAERLLSEDLQSGTRLAGVLIDNPFATTA